MSIIYLDRRELDIYLKITKYFYSIRIAVAAINKACCYQLLVQSFINDSTN
ncbi:hypothetical protein IQ247_18875 [Plectonema cf. radiosum LEGE 06105]|uniref:Uncharacterized protein n=1 Tax=Plectonema cf. radiosum LEGE 06105 TaxID=945769 RepID=A0A8J7FJ36_9CYAN|nr:hypothetical protein [Plectonema radiosum]MBE9214706.1 hypothetical protein [Plectonema cf. radiosum LEGE 06105]